MTSAVFKKMLFSTNKIRKCGTNSSAATSTL